MGIMMNDETLALALNVIERAPQWLRHDLLSKNIAARGRAEETLAAQIADALVGGIADATEDYQDASVEGLTAMRVMWLSKTKIVTIVLKHRAPCHLPRCRDERHYPDSLCGR